MRHPATLTLITTLLVTLLALPAQADRSTPFVEAPGNKVGEVSEAHGYVVSTDDAATSFLVIVTSDTMQYIVINAKADKGVVPADLIGRWAIIKAQVVKPAAKSGQGEGAELKILSVTAPPKKP